MPHGLPILVSLFPLKKRSHTNQGPQSAQAAVKVPIVARQARSATGSVKKNHISEKKIGHKRFEEKRYTGSPHPSSCGTRSNTRRARRHAGEDVAAFCSTPVDLTSCGLYTVSGAGGAVAFGQRGPGVEAAHVVFVLSGLEGGSVGELEEVEEDGSGFFGGTDFEGPGADLLPGGEGG